MFSYALNILELKGLSNSVWFSLKPKTRTNPYAVNPLEPIILQELSCGHFFRSRSDRTRNNGYKLKEGEFRLDIAKKFSTESS